jgi:hypothetical protein
MVEITLNVMSSPFSVFPKYSPANAFYGTGFSVDAGWNSGSSIIITRGGMPEVTVRASGLRQLEISSTLPQSSAQRRCNDLFPPS